MLATLSWHVDPSHTVGEIRVASIVELDQQLDALAQQFSPKQPVLVDVVRERGDTLSIGIGSPLLVDEDGNAVDFAPKRPITILSYVSQNGDPPYYVSRGGESIPCLVVFFYGGHWSEFSGDSAIALSDAREALRQFVTSEDLPRNVQWDEV